MKNLLTALCLAALLLASAIPGNAQLTTYSVPRVAVDTPNITCTPTALSEAATTVTVTCGAGLPAGMVAGVNVNLAGNVPAGYNGTFPIATISSGTAFTITSFPVTGLGAGTAFGSATIVGPQGIFTTVSGLQGQVAPGPIVCNGAVEYLNKSNLTLAASSTNYVYFRCANDELIASTTSPNNADIPLATVVTTASAISTITDNRIPKYFPATEDGYFIVPPTACSWKTSGTTGATNNTIVADGASFTPVMQGSSTAAGASNNSLTCLITVPSKLTAGRGVVINDIVVPYGVQTTALTSLGTPTFGTITLPAPGTAETPSTVAPVAAGGTLVVTPAVASANLGTTTAGSYFTEKCALATPVALNTDLVMLYFTQIFAQSAAAAQLVSTPGLIVHYTSVPI